MMKKNRDIIYIALIITIIIITFYNSFYNGFVWDDERNIINNSYLRDFSLKNLKNILFYSYDGSIQPVKSLSYFIQYNLWKLNPLPYHIWNIILYITNVILIYFFIIDISKSSVIAFITCILFSVHPLHSEIVAALFGKEYMYGSIFFLASLLLFIKYLKREKKYIYILSIILYIMALMSKEFTLALFPLFILYDFTFVNRLNIKNLCRRFFIYIPFIISSFLFLYILMAYTERVRAVSGLSALFNLLMDIEIFTLFYFSKLLYPIRLHPMYNIKGLYLTYMILSLFIFLLIFLSLIISWKKSKPVFYMTLWLLIGLIPHSHFIIPVTFVAADRYIYFSSLSLSFFFSLILLKLYNFRNDRQYRLFSIALMITIISLYMNITISQNRIWENNLILWSYVTSSEDDYKDMGLAFNYLGDSYIKNNEPERAIEAYNKSLIYSKDKYTIKIKLGLLFLETGDYDSAIRHLEDAKKLRSNSTEVYNNLALAYLYKGMKDRAAEEYRKSLSLDPFQGDIKKNLDIIVNSGL